MRPDAPSRVDAPGLVTARIAGSRRDHGSFYHEKSGETPTACALQMSANDPEADIESSLN
jgi:hypothetical protein